MRARHPLWVSSVLNAQLREMVLCIYSSHASAHARSWRVLIWFCAPYDACCGWQAFRSNLFGLCIPIVLAVPLYLPCLVCLKLSRCVRSCKGMCSDAAFNATYIPLMCLALSFRWLWKHFCCARSCCCLGPTPGRCGPGCTERHGFCRCHLCAKIKVSITAAIITSAMMAAGALLNVHAVKNPKAVARPCLRIRS